MSFTKAITDRFIYSGDKLDTESRRKGAFFIITIYIFLFVTLFYLAYLAFYVPDILKDATYYGNFFFCGLLGSLIFIYKYFGRRVILVNIMAVLTYFSAAATYEGSGGVYSLDLMWYALIPAWFFLVGNKQTGLFWFGISIVIMVFFYYAEYKGYHDFRKDANTNSAEYYFANFLFVAISMLLITYIHESNKEKYMKEVFKAKEKIEFQKEDIISSINYAKRIQRAILPLDESIARAIPHSFIFYKPRDIVSGDFYWFHEMDRDNYILVCADCTGHGVPGALMTVVGSNLLSQIIVEGRISKPADILVELDKRITTTLKQQKENDLIIQDGMDLALLKVDKGKREFIFTSAKRPAIFIHDHVLEEFKGSKNTLGGLRSDEKSFDEIKKQYNDNDVIYLFTDGIADQFGGVKNKKFTIKRFRELVLEIHGAEVAGQKQQMEKEIGNWIGANEQTDDILVIGIRF